MTTPEVEPWIDDDGWVHLHHPATFGTTAVRNVPAVLAGMLGRGWAYTPKPPPEPDPIAPVVIDVTATAPAVEANATEVFASGEAATVVFHPFDPSALTVAQVIEAVTADPGMAAAALTAERAGKNRTSLIPQLEALAAGATTTDQEPENG